MSLKKGNRRVIIMHLTTPSLEIQVTGEYTVKTVKSTREILKDAVSSFPTKSSASQCCHTLLLHPPQPPASWSLVPLPWRGPESSPAARSIRGPFSNPGAALAGLVSSWGCSTLSLNAGEPRCRLQKAAGAGYVLAGGRLTPQEGAAAFPGNMQAGGRAGEGAPGTRDRCSGRGMLRRAGTVPANPSPVTLWELICLPRSVRSPQGLPLLPVRAALPELLLSLAPGRSHRADPEQRLFPAKHPRGTAAGDVPWKTLRHTAGKRSLWSG